MLLVEGSDLVGKTTFCKELVNAVTVIGRRKADVAYDHFGLLSPPWRYYQDYIPRICTWKVCDRMHLSEYVYGKALRDGCKINRQAFRMISGEIIAQGGYVVALVTDAMQYKKILNQRWTVKEAFSKDQLAMVNDCFVNAMLNLHDESFYVDEWIDPATTEFDLRTSERRAMVMRIARKYVNLQTMRERRNER